MAEQDTVANEVFQPALRPAFYALRPGGLRDVVTILHPPYTAWHLSYVVFGAVAAGHLHVDRLLATLAAFFLAVGIAAHALDERLNRPLRTRLPDRALTLLAGASLGGAVAIGVAGMVVVTLTLAPFVVAGGFLVIAYNLELWHGRFHTAFWFAAGWGAFPALTSWWINTAALPGLHEAGAGLAVGVGCGALSVVQRRLSRPLRDLRRRTVAVHGTQQLADGSTVQLSVQSLMTPLEGALQATAAGLVALAVALLEART